MQEEQLPLFVAAENDDNDEQLLELAAADDNEQLLQQQTFYEKYCLAHDGSASFVRRMLQDLLTEQLDREGGVENVDKLQIIIDATQLSLAASVKPADRAFFYTRLGQYAKIMRLAQFIAQIDAHPQCITTPVIVRWRQRATLIDAVITLF